jgi:hypothetical protein
MNIDAVITWVDGQDPTHQAKRQAHVNTLPNAANHDAIAPTRFNQCGEIDYCVRSVLQFAPWVRTIYIVTDNQTPVIMNKLSKTMYADKIKVIDHRVIFEGYEDYLPTFNSLAIESMLWRIPNLSEHFLYLNDDCFIVAPVKPEHFIRDNHVVLRGEWKTPTARKLRYTLRRLLGKMNDPIVNYHRHWQEQAAQRLGFQRRFFSLPHCPFLLRKSLFQDFFQENPQQLLKNIAHRVRDPEQLWMISLATHMEIRHQRALFENNAHKITVNPECHSLEKIQKRLGKHSPSTPFVCIQSMDTASETTQQWLFDWLDARIA